MIFLQNIRMRIISFLILGLFSFCLWPNFNFINAEINELEENLNTKSSNPKFDFDDYKGTWLIQIQNKPFYLVIKRNQIAHYFYKDGNNANVYSSFWNIDQNGVMYILNLLSYDLTFDLSNKQIHLLPTNNDIGDLTNEATSMIKKIDASMLGTWSLPPNYEPPRTFNMPSTYFGLWKITNQEKNELIEIQNNRKVFSLKSQSTNTSDTIILYGEWSKHGKQLHITWEDGSYSILDNTTPNFVKLYDFKSGEIITDKKQGFRLISSNLKSKDKIYWEKHKDLVDSKSIIKLNHFSQKELLKFYRGDWILMGDRDSKTFDIIQFGRFGGVQLNSNKRTRGTWYPSAKNTLLNLGAGIRMQFRSVGSGFIFLVYEATRPLDAYPSKVLRTAPLNRSKLHNLNFNAIYAEKLLEQVPLSGLKQTASLFSSQSGLHPILAENPNPWWWPIWSDNPLNESIKSKRKDAEFLAKINLNQLTKDPLSIASRDSTEKKKSINDSTILNLNSQFIKPIKNPWSWPF